MMIDLRQSQPSKRGAARVNVVWLVVLLVGFFVAVGLAYVSQDEAALNRDSAKAARERESEADRRFEQARRELNELSAEVGFYPADLATPVTAVSALKQGFEQFRGTFPNMDTGVKTVEEALRRASAAYLSVTRENQTLKQQLAGVQGEVVTKNSSIVELQAEKDRLIANLQRQLQDGTAAAEARQRQLEDEVSTVRRSLRDRESELSATRASLQDQARTNKESERLAQTRMREMGRKLQVFQREPEAADGSVLAVSSEMGLAWINRGERDRMFRGMRFRIVDGAVGSDRIKGWCEVVRVQDDMAEVMLFDLADRFNPPVPGDMVYNPLYDPSGGRNAVLVGRFSGSYNEKELRALLTQINISVQPRVNETTDFLIVGAELYSDEDGEPLEDPISPEELPEYKEAVAVGVQVVPLRDVRRYFQRTQL
jgi:hypothetical protein